MVHINTILPPEMLTSIFQQLEIVELKNAKLVCKLWRNLIRYYLKFQSKSWKKTNENFRYLKVHSVCYFFQVLKDNLSRFTEQSSLQ